MHKGNIFIFQPYSIDKDPGRRKQIKCTDKIIFRKFSFSVIREAIKKLSFSTNKTYESNKQKKAQKESFVSKYYCHTHQKLNENET